MSFRGDHTILTVDRIHRNASWEPACRLLVSGGQRTIVEGGAGPCLFGGLLKIGVPMKLQHLCLAETSVFLLISQFSSLRLWHLKQDSNLQFFP